MSEFIPIAVAAEKAACGRPIEVGRKAVLMAIVEGLLSARAFRARVTELTYGNDKSFEIEEALAKDGSIDGPTMSWIGGSGPDGEIESFRPFTGLDAYAFLKAKDGEWNTTNKQKGYQRECWSDWSLGRFHHRTLAYRDRHISSEDERGYNLFSYQFFGIEVESSQVDHLLIPHLAPNVSEEYSKSNREAMTTYDWDGAFAYVAAAFYFDIQYQDINSRGVQTDIVNLMRTYFKKRNQAEPGDTILKAKARKIQAALRDHKSD